MRFDAIAASRRRFLLLAGGGALTAAIGSAIAEPRPAWADPVFSSNPFTLGVASGEPAPDGVVLWTRLAVDPLAPDGRGGLPDKRIEVAWQVAEDERFARVVRAGSATATPQLAHSVHVEVNGLRPDRIYFYRFRSGEYVSRVGRTRTAPAYDAKLRSLSLGFVSCQNLPEGYFTPLHHLAQDDLDVVIHLGDYIYEGGSQGTIGRGHLPAAEAFSLADYRVRHGQYKLDPDLQQAHAVFPWLVTIDDHDVENNWAGSASQPDSEPDQDPAVFLQRRAYAFQAYYENTPLRLTAKPEGPDMKLYRRLAYGDLAQISMVDTRQYRDGQVLDAADRDNPAHQMLGPTQERWLLDGMGAAAQTWKVMGNQVFVMQADHTEGPGVRWGLDTWDGHTAARKRLFDGLLERKVENVVILTGDAHRSVAADLKLNFDDLSSPTVGTEFLGTSISSGKDGAAMDELGRIWLAENPHMKFHNAQRGYVRCTITPSEWRSDYLVVPYVSRPGAPLETAARIYVEAGTPGIQHVEQG